jgi:hypothetical protein
VRVTIRLTQHIGQDPGGWEVLLGLRFVLEDGAPNLDKVRYGVKGALSADQVEGYPAL